jgi:phosphatidylinositol N-acetylglucosaminyltransferase subunit Q
MVTNNGLMRIFWPSDAPRKTSPGTLVGFRNSGQDVFVIAILLGVDVRGMQDAEIYR